MSRARVFCGVLLCVALVVGRAGADEARKDVARLMRVMPAGFSVLVVVPDLEKLDKSVSSLFKRFEPDHAGPWMVRDIKREVAIGEWIDFSRPIGIAAPSVVGDEGIVLWASVPGFAEKVKSLPNATREEGVWEIPSEGDDALFARIKGEYVVVATSKENLARATEDGKSLGDELKGRAYLFEKRDLLVHVNIEPLRPNALAGIAQFAQMAPMFAMMAGQQSGVDPAAITAIVQAFTDGAKRFVEQIAYVDITVGMNDKAVDLTIATGYEDGPIKTYLTNQKPASIPLLKHLQEQPYFLAVGYHVPGDGSPFYDYVLDKAISAMGASPMVGDSAPKTEDGKSATGANSMKEGLKVAREYYRSFDASNMIMAMSPEGLRISGDYRGKDPHLILELTRKSMTAANPLMMQFGGAQYESLGARQIGNVSVEEFTMKLDTTNPAAAAMAGMYGQDSRFALGIAGDSVRFCLGSEAYVEGFFTRKVDKPFSSGRYVVDALAALPARRNAVVLVDLAGILPMVGPMMGMPKMEPIAPGPPVAISASLSGEPARLDIHVPVRAVERLMQAFAPDEPM